MTGLARAAADERQQIVIPATSPPLASPAFMYVGTFPRAHQSDPADTAFGIYVLRAGQSSGRLEPADLAPAPRAGWLAPHPSGRFLYAVHEVREFAGRPGGGVSAFAVDPVTGRLAMLGSRPTTGRLPCHCALDQAGRYLLVSTYLDGTVELFPIEADGRLGPVREVHWHQGASVHPRRQASAHAHSVTFDPAFRFALVADLGADRIVVYEFDGAHGTLIPHPGRDACVAPGSGPRHLVFRPDARFAYLVSEMAATITVLAYDAATGTPRPVQAVSTLPDGFAGFRAAAEIAVHPSGRFLYATNRSYGSSGEPPQRGEDSIAWFAIDPDSGRLTPRGRARSGGETPRSFVIDPGGTWLYIANQRSANITAYRIDAVTGDLGPAVHVTQTPVPVCVQLVTVGGWHQAANRR
jgi:6-phosphogluconolactonase